MTQWVPCKSPLATRWTFRGERDGWMYWSSPSGKLYRKSVATKQWELKRK